MAGYGEGRRGYAIIEGINIKELVGEIVVISYSRDCACLRDPFFFFFFSLGE